MKLLTPEQYRAKIDEADEYIKYANDLRDRAEKAIPTRLNSGLTDLIDIMKEFRYAFQILSSGNSVLKKTGGKYHYQATRVELEKFFESRGIKLDGRVRPALETQPERLAYGMICIADGIMQGHYITGCDGFWRDE
jgi:hypothetical protein